MSRLPEFTAALRRFRSIGKCRADLNRAGTVFNFGYGQADRLTTVQQGSSPVATYTYDAFGQRLLKALTGPPAITTLYQYDLAGHQIEDSDISSGSPNFQADYIYLGDRPVGLVLPGSGLTTTTATS